MIQCSSCINFSFIEVVPFLMLLVIIKTSQRTNINFFKENLSISVFLNFSRSHQCINFSNPLTKLFLSHDQHTFVDLNYSLLWSLHQVAIHDTICFWISCIFFIDCKNVEALIFEFLGNRVSSKAFNYYFVDILDLYTFVRFKWFNRSCNLFLDILHTFYINIVLWLFRISIPVHLDLKES